MPTFREELHLGRKVPTTDTADIVNGAITEPKLADDAVSTRTIQDGAVTMEKLSEEVQELVRCPWTPEGDFDIDATYDINDVVYDAATNTTYISMRSNNTGHPVDENAEGYETGWWMKALEVPVSAMGTIAEEKVKVPVVVKSAEPDPGMAYVMHPRTMVLFGTVNTLDVTIREPGTKYGPEANSVTEYMFSFTSPRESAATLNVATGTYPLMWTPALNIQPNTYYEVRISYNKLKEMYFGKIEGWAFPEE